jgi:hypothetical protein
MSDSVATRSGTVLNPIPMTTMLDAQGRPYFLWDCDITLERFKEKLADPDPEPRAYFMGKLMRQAKPDDVFIRLCLLSPEGIDEKGSGPGDTGG